MRWRNPLLDEFRRLQGEANRQRRGFDFQLLVGEIFERAHFDITHNAGSARPRQTDLFATRGSEHYLIETKWRSRAPFDVGDVDSLLARLDRTEDSVVGVVVSMSGFSPNAVHRVLERRDRPVLLFDATDVENLVRGDADLVKRLRQKREALRTHGRVLLDDEDLPGKRARRRRSMLPSDAAFFLLSDGTRRDWFEAQGDFGEFVFADEIQDIDWVTAGGYGVVADLALRHPNRLGIPGLMEKLNAVGWATASGRWNIQQATRNWHGLGAASLVQAMNHWQSRYAGVENLHHTEQFCYQDAAEGGLYTLTGDVSASEDRTVWNCDLSLQLIGVPMEVDPIRQLAQALGAIEPWYFRPRAEKSVHRRFFRRSERHSLAPLALVVEPDHDDEARIDNWVTGIVVKNPFREANVGEDVDLEGVWLPIVSQSDVVVCSLGPHHPLDEPRESYFLRDCEWTWTSDALVFRAVADWD